MAGAVFGAVMLGIDCAVGMPLSWTVGKGLTWSCSARWYFGSAGADVSPSEPLSLEAGLIIMPSSSITESSLRYGATCTVWL